MVAPDNRNAETAAIQVEAFERWWALRANWPREWAAVANEAFQAGAASRQGEVDKLNAVIDRALDYIKSLEGLLP